MNQTAFVSHASPDKEIADEIVGFLEKRGVTCWIAPRDLRPGHEYASEIIRGIAECPVMILVLSEHANNSVFVKREIERGVSQGKPVFPIRVREVLPSQSLELFISSHHWIDAWKPPLEQYLGRLVDAIQVVVGGQGNGVGTPTHASRDRRSEPSANKRRKAGRGYWVGGLSAALAIGAVVWGVQKLPADFLREGTSNIDENPGISAPLSSNAEPAAEIESTFPDPTVEQTVDDERRAADSGPAGMVHDDTAATVNGSTALEPVVESADEGLPFERVLTILENQSGSQRYKTIKTLADAIPAALTADQALAIVGSSAYRLHAIGLLKDRLPTTMSFDDIMQFAGPVKGNERYNTIKLFADRMPQNLTTDQTLAIVASSAYRLHAIGLLKDRLPETLSFDDIMQFAAPVKGSERYNTIKLFADRIAGDLTAEQIEMIVDTSSYQNEARTLLRKSSDRS